MLSPSCRPADGFPVLSEAVSDGRLRLSADLRRASADRGRTVTMLRPTANRRSSGANFVRPRSRFSRRIGSSLTRFSGATSLTWEAAAVLSSQGFEVRGPSTGPGHGHVHDAELPEPLATSPCDSRDRRLGAAEPGVDGARRMGQASRFWVHGSRCGGQPILHPIRPRYTPPLLCRKDGCELRHLPRRPG